MEPEDFYLVADELAQSVAGRTDPFVRSAVSRIYYGAFHESQAHLPGKDFRVSPTGHELHSSHEGVIEWLRDANATAGRALAELRDRRTWADYQLGRTGSNQEIEEARHLKRTIRQYLGLE